MDLAQVHLYLVDSASPLTRSLDHWLASIVNITLKLHSEESKYTSASPRSTCFPPRATSTQVPRVQVQVHRGDSRGGLGLGRGRLELKLREEESKYSEARPRCTCSPPLFWKLVALFLFFTAHLGWMLIWHEGQLWQPVTRPLNIWTWWFTRHHPVYAIPILISELGSPCYRVIVYLSVSCYFFAWHHIVCNR